MEMLKRFEVLVLLIVFIGALNWGVFGITGGSTNVLGEIFGTGTLAHIVYVVIGVAGVLMIPRLLEAFRLGAGPHPRGT